MNRYRPTGGFELCDRIKSAACVIIAGLIFFTPAMADDPDFLVVGGGWYDFNDNRDAFDFRAEYRSGYKALGFLKPWAGIEATSDQAFYGLFGVLTDLYYGRRWVLTPSFGAGLYLDGDGKDLGHTIEFRSQLEFGYRLDDRSRMSLAIGHISNASLADNNPGTEIATVYYHIPFDSVID